MNDIGPRAIKHGIPKYLTFNKLSRITRIKVILYRTHFSNKSHGGYLLAYILVEVLFWAVVVILLYYYGGAKSISITTCK